MSNARILQCIEPAREFFIGVDSDGTVFDSMELKHKECFAPMFIKHFQLQAVSKYAREVWEFVNLYSTTRGINRYLGAVRSLKMLRERGEVKARNARIPDTQALEEWIGRESRLSHEALQAEVDGGNHALRMALAWTLDVNRAVEEIVTEQPPFPFFRESLDKMTPKADVICVSQAPTATLAREWRHSDIEGSVRFIAGQEFGGKKDHLQYAAAGKYPPEKILMIGDAPGDLEAARHNGALFYPIVPGREEASWERFLNEGADRFFVGAFAGEYETELIREFDATLRECPPWQSDAGTK